MSTEMEDRIRQWVDTEVAGVDPVTLDEVLDRAAAPTTEPNEAAAGSRRRWLIPAVAAAAVILVAAVGFVALGGSDEPQELVVASPDGEDATDDIPASEPEGPGVALFASGRVKYRSSTRSTSAGVTCRARFS